MEINSVWNRLSTQMETGEVDYVVGGGFDDGLKIISNQILATVGIHHNKNGFNLITTKRDE